MSEVHREVNGVREINCLHCRKWLPADSYDKGTRQYKSTICKECGKEERSWKRLLIYKHYCVDGLVRCQCPKCDVTNLDFLTLDHTENNGAQERKSGLRSIERLYAHLVKNNWPSGYSVLCFNCNSGRDLQVDKVCPHMITKESAVCVAEW